MRNILAERYILCYSSTSNNMYLSVTNEKVVKVMNKKLETRYNKLKNEIQAIESNPMSPLTSPKSVTEENKSSNKSTA